MTSGSNPDFALVDQALIILVEELDRVLDRDDMPRSMTVDIPDHRRQCCRFSTARRTGHQDHPSRFHRQLLNDRRKIQLVNRLDFEWDDPKDRAHHSPLLKQVGSKPPQSWNPIAEVQFPMLYKLLSLQLRGDETHRCFEVTLSKARSIPHRDKPMVDSQNRWGADFQVEVGGASFDSQPQ